MRCDALHCIAMQCKPFLHLKGGQHLTSLDEFTSKKIFQPFVNQNIQLLWIKNIQLMCNKNIQLVCIKNISQLLNQEIFVVFSYCSLTSLFLLFQSLCICQNWGSNFAFGRTWRILSSPMADLIFLAYSKRSVATASSFFFSNLAISWATCKAGCQYLFVWVGGESYPLKFAHFFCSN